MVILILTNDLLACFLIHVKLMQHYVTEWEAYLTNLLKKQNKKKTKNKK